MNQREQKAKGYRRLIERKKYYLSPFVPSVSFNLKGTPCPKLLF